jgi:predicted outer membrane repeat protein
MNVISCIFKGNPSQNAITAYNIHEVEIRGCTFDSNLGEIGGAVYAESDHSDNSKGSLKIIDSVFIRNKAKRDGGAIGSFYTMVYIRESSFISNEAGSTGGAIYHRASLFSCSDCTFDGNSANQSGGAIYHYSDEISLLSGSMTFVHNEAKNGHGGAIYCKNFDSFYQSTIEFTDHGIIDNNTAVYGGFSYMEECWLSLAGDITFVNNKAMKGGMAYLKNSVLDYKGGVTNVSNNRAKDAGGALYLSDSSRIYIKVVIRIINNTVTSSGGKGGAIYFLDDSYRCDDIASSSIKQSCFISYQSDFGELEPKPMLFQGNSADEGSVIYGGLFNLCGSTVDFDPFDKSNPSNYLPVTEKIDQIAEYEHTPFAVTSDSVKLCLCSSENEPQCGVRTISTAKMRGEVVSINTAAVDQKETAKESVIRARYDEIKAQLDKGEGTREIKNRCTEFNYHIYTVETSATLILRSDGPCVNSHSSLLTININVIPCAQGFEQAEDRCVCDRRLSDTVTSCDINTQSLQRRGHVWLRYDEMHLKVNQNCPLDFCETKNFSISTTLPDKQCANNRAGVMCGSCEQNYSLELGGSKCRRCDGSSKYTFIWLLVAFAISGVALVLLILTCKLTTSVGAINGLIFYANIISVSGVVNLSKCSLNPALKVFISWINLDLGIETCFYPGLDTYQKTWLQFAFPLYIWLLVAAITTASYYSSTAMKIFGRNNIAVLATLFLLSYTKILQTITTALSFSEVLQGRAGDVKSVLVPYTVWTHDGNVEYLRGKHIPLFVAALLFLLLLFLPYTLALSLGQCLRSMRTRRGLRWVNGTAFVSVMDAYHAPFNRKHRYWTGLMLLTRCVLFVTFAANFKEGALLSNMYATTLVTIGILAIKVNVANVYKNPLKEKLELSFILNLAVLAASIYYSEGRGEDTTSCKCLRASLSMTLATFVAILAYQAHLQLSSTAWYKKLCRNLHSEWQGRKKNDCQEVIPADTSETEPVYIRKVPTTTVLQLREPLLEDM